MKKTTRKFQGVTRPILLIAIAAGVICGTSYAQTLIGSPGAGWQTWTAAIDQNGNGLNLNNSGAPYWDVTWGASGGYNGNPANKNACGS